MKLQTDSTNIRKTGISMLGLPFNVLKSDPHILDHLLQTLFVCVFYVDVFVLLPLLWLCLPVMMGDKFSAGEVGPAQVIKSQQNSTRLVIIHSTVQC